MRVRLKDFDPKEFTLHDDPVLVLQDFWSREEMTRFRNAMQSAPWVARQDMSDTSGSFPGCGNWLKAEIADPERSAFIERVLMPFIAEYIDSFPNVVGRVMSFNYFNYAMGDCLSLHSDERSEREDDERRETIARRIALTSYVHERWDANWGGELIIYDERSPGDEGAGFEISNCIAPDPGSLVLFTVPRHHRVCRVDPLAGQHKRLSIAGWFMTDHGKPATL